MSRATPHTYRHFFFGLLTGALLGIGAIVGIVVTRGSGPEPILRLPETALHATATDSSSTLAVATGAMDDGMEGLYTLDFITGQLQCAVLNRHTGRFGGLFQANVIADLGIDARQQNPRYLLVTGIVNFTRGAGIARPARSVAYVVDANTGRFGAYLVPWQRGLASAGRPQAGAMKLLDVGNARTATIRQ